MKNTSIKKSDKFQTFEYDLSEFFNLYNKVENGVDSYYYNINRTVIINTDKIPVSYYETYVVNENDTWTGISYNVFGTIELWWLILKFNNINNPIELPETGTTLKIPKTNLTKQIMKAIQSNE